MHRGVDNGINFKGDNESDSKAYHSIMSLALHFLSHLFFLARALAPNLILSYSVRAGSSWTVFLPCQYQESDGHEAYSWMRNKIVLRVVTSTVQVVLLVYFYIWHSHGEIGPFVGLAGQLISKTPMMISGPFWISWTKYVSVNFAFPWCCLDANIHHEAHDHQLLVTWTNSGTWWSFRWIVVASSSVTILILLCVHWSIMFRPVSSYSHLLLMAVLELLKMYSFRVSRVSLLSPSASHCWSTSFLPPFRSLPRTRTKLENFVVPLAALICSIDQGGSPWTIGIQRWRLT